MQTSHITIAPKDLDGYISFRSLYPTKGYTRIGNGHRLASITITTIINHQPPPPTFPIMPTTRSAVPASSRTRSQGALPNQATQAAKAKCAAKQKLNKKTKRDNGKDDSNDSGGSHNDDNEHEQHDKETMETMQDDGGDDGYDSGDGDHNNDGGDDEDDSNKNDDKKNNDEISGGKGGNEGRKSRRGGGNTKGKKKCVFIRFSIPVPPTDINSTGHQSSNFERTWPPQHPLN